MSPHHRILVLALVAGAVSAAPGPAQTANSLHNPTWWDKYQQLVKNGPDPAAGATTSVSVGENVDVSNECGPQSETYITINPSRPNALAAGSNEIFRLPMRGYFSTDGGASWGGVDLPLPPPIGTNGVDFGSDPTLAFDSSNNLYYGYIVVFFGAAFNTPGLGVSINGTEMAVARSTDGGKTYGQVTFFEFNGGENHFNDKPMITADTSAKSPFRDSVYIAWDAALGGSSSGGIRVARSRDHGLSFTTTRIDDAKGPGNGIGTTITTGPQGQVYVAWNDIAANNIAFNSSFDGGVTWGTPRVIAAKRIPFDIGIPAEFNRRALIYPACDTDRSKGPHRGRINCSWADLTPDGLDTDIFASVSDDQGATWSAPRAVAESFAGVDRFNHWLATDPVTGVVNVSFYDTRNDSTGGRFETDVYLSQSDDGVTFAPSLRVTDAKSNEHDCNGLFPCRSINYGNQQGDYEGVAAFNGVVHPIWTDSRRNTERAGDPTCGRGRGIMEEVFTAVVR
jgi:hypothetical protein